MIEAALHGIDGVLFVYYLPSSDCIVYGAFVAAAVATIISLLAWVVTFFFLFQVSYTSGPILVYTPEYIPVYVCYERNITTAVDVKSTSGGGISGLPAMKNSTILLSGLVMGLSLIHI